VLFRVGRGYRSLRSKRLEVRLEAHDALDAKCLECFRELIDPLFEFGVQSPVWNFGHAWGSVEQDDCDTVRITS